LRGDKVPILRDTYSGGTLQSASRIYYTTDANDNVTSVLGQSGSTWVVVERNVYDAYGTVTVYNSTWTTALGGYASSTVGNTLMYAGLSVDLATGLQHADLRWYNSATATWTAQDPDGYAASGPNLYGYCGDDPLTRTDPTGLRIAHCVSTPLDRDEYVQVPDTWHGGDPCPVLVGNGGNDYGWHETTLSTTEAKAAKLCAGVAKCKRPGCTVASCEKTMAKFLTAVKNTKIINPWGIGGRLFPAARNPCQRWVDALQRNLPPDFAKNPCITIVKDSPTGDLGHATLVIQLCDGSLIGADNGTMNPTGEGIFVEPPRFPLGDWPDWKPKGVPAAAK
jgi:RHS repeat-associated protein